ncbi:hypothetical protein [Streptomyces rugosispiralis]|uniref:Uncharacterized protein n=1 Tax=Streptomyces rugosispiralis TaxID=2967341 RepID=A0ABT1VB96_9ACTN|nr:hypothetical protein [Streptomyces rugosispiralis]MCQ8194673.1 hypothetical protein [Streptomyces rugosispiralis]
MRSTSSVTTRLATILFVSQAPVGEFTASPTRTRELIHETIRQLGRNSAALADAEFAYEYGRHPETAAAHMRVCLQAVTATLAPADKAVAR